jgi:hypothetical protein
MPIPPFEVLTCSWPRPVASLEGRWTSDPEWDAPRMPSTPIPRWCLQDGEPCWMIDWREFFRGGLEDHGIGGQMRQFHVTFTVRVQEYGTLVFWDDDGCIIRRNGRHLHEDRSAHVLTRHELAVNAEDILEIAQWQLTGGWLWGARASGLSQRRLRPDELITGYAARSARRCRTPEGPPLKVFTDGRTPVRAAAAIHSLILNGYAPSQVLLYGDSQWSSAARDTFSRALPFAQVVPTGDVVSRIRAAGGPQLADWARRYWWVMKTCIALIEPPAEFCMLDDDLFVLDSVSDALAAFHTHDLVFAPDADHGSHYAATWARVLGISGPITSGTFNAGLYWCRQRGDARQIAANMLRVSPTGRPNFYWEQGFIAAVYARRPHLALPTPRYFYPLFDGLPGGILGYDFRRNPCGFASMHFGGLGVKPTDDIMGLLLPDLLWRHLPHLPDEETLFAVSGLSATPVEVGGEW